MARLLGLRIQNYRSLADVKLGQLSYNERDERLPKFLCLIGPNGSGKSTLMDVFGFIGDCLREGVEAACDKPHRGGFSRLRTQDETGPIRFELYYEPEADHRPVHYQLAIGDEGGIPVVVEETLLQARKGKARGRLYPFLKLRNGEGTAWSGEQTEGQKGAESKPVALPDRGTLGIATLGNLKEHPRIVSLRRYLEEWYLSYFVPDAARTLPPTGAQKHLNRTGSNIGNVLQYMERQSPEKVREVLERITGAIPGLRKIETLPSPDGRLLLRFDEAGYRDPFYQASMSDGTLKMFAYMLLFEDPEPAPFIGIEEPENGLYPKLLFQLARHFARKTEGPNAPQAVVTTHSPHFVNALSPGQVWFIQKDERGRAKVTRTSDIAEIRALVDEGLFLGNLWYSDHIEDRVELP